MRAPKARAEILVSPHLLDRCYAPVQGFQMLGSLQVHFACSIISMVLGTACTVALIAQTGGSVLPTVAGVATGMLGALGGPAAASTVAVTGSIGAALGFFAGRPTAALKVITNNNHGASRGVQRGVLTPF